MCYRCELARAAEFGTKNCFSCLSGIPSPKNATKLKYESHTVYVCKSCENYVHSCEFCKKKYFDRWNEEGACGECISSLSSGWEKQKDFKFYYGTKIVTEDALRHIPFLGVELEIEVNRDLTKTGMKIKRTLGNKIAMKDDGSLDSGYELVSAPSTLSGHKYIWKKYWELIESDANLLDFEPESAGMHVHVSRAALSTEQIDRIVKFVLANKRYVQQIAGRDENEYCHYTTGRNDRYEAVNLKNSKTIEFRIFQSVNRSRDFYKNLEFVDAVVKYCERPRPMTFAAFATWAQTMKRYENLNKFVRDRGLIAHAQRQQGALV